MPDARPADSGSANVNAVTRRVTPLWVACNAQFGHLDDPPIARRGRKPNLARKNTGNVAHVVRAPEPWNP
jgi:hypothetical protein